MVALLGFGYRLALYVYQRGLTGFLGQVTCFLADIILHHYIARWIAQRGGWVSACLGLGYPPAAGAAWLAAVTHPVFCFVLFCFSLQVAALSLRRDPILSVVVIFGVVLLGQFVVHRFFRS